VSSKRDVPIIIEDPTIAPPGTKFVDGKTGPGAFYVFFLPPSWNGDLVLYAHGYIDPAEPVGLPPVTLEQIALRSYFLQAGYGVAYSSYSENGWAVKDGVIRTKQLIGLYTSYFGKPSDVYVIGHSLGGFIALMLAEKNPELFAGAMPICSSVGGAEKQLEYILNVRVLFDYFFPGVLPGTAIEIPDPDDIDFNADIVPAVTNAIISDLVGFPPPPPPPYETLQLASVVQISIPYDPDPSNRVHELTESILSALYFNFVGTNDMLDRTHQHMMVDNTDTVYTYPDPMGPLPNQFDDDEGVKRYASTPDAGNYIRHWYQPTGKLKIPVLMLHTTRDPQVPVFHEDEYAALVAEEGNTEFLYQHIIDRFGHGNFTLGEHITAFEFLVDRVKTGDWGVWP
jgi:pimeloyl-ACP methyl ester carboxylesterase